MMILLLLLHICGLTGADTEAAILCTSDACFTLHLNKLSFEDASLKCKDNGGYLITVEDSTKEAEIQSIISIDGTNQDSDLRFWIGLKLRRGQCVIDGLSLRGFNWIPETTEHTYSNWEKEPLRTCMEDRCVMIHHRPTRSTPNLRWTDRPCKDTAFYACKFKFQGMCKPLLVTGGTLTYTLPFNGHPLNEDNHLSSLPFGTFAEVSCNDKYIPYMYICKLVEGLFRWTVPGTDCVLDMHSCSGCDQNSCSGSDPGCACKDGDELDKVSCGAKNHCHGAPCQYQCVTNGASFLCVCPEGFQLDTDGINCIDIDECQIQACGDHRCINTQGSFTCVCLEGYEMVGGKCRDIDECTVSKCSQKCLNSQGSFSCHCVAGFIVSEDGQCVDVDECLANRCEFKCRNTIGSFKCSCQTNFRLHPNGITCVLDLAVSSTPPATSSDQIAFTHAETTASMAESLTVPTVSDTEEPPPDTVSVELEQPTRKVTFGANAHSGKTLNSRMMLCVIGSVVPLGVLIAVTFGIIIFRHGRSKRELKRKSAAADSYCWVSSGLEINNLGNLDGSKLTDDH